MVAMSFSFSTCPSSVERITISPNSSGVMRRPLYFMVYWYVSSEFSPNDPVADSMFCSASTAETSEGIRRYCPITSGFIQMRRL